MGPTDAIAVLIGGHLAVAAVVALLLHWAGLTERFELIRVDLAQRGHTASLPDRHRGAHRRTDRAAVALGAADPPTSVGTGLRPRSRGRSS